MHSWPRSKRKGYTLVEGKRHDNGEVWMIEIVHDYSWYIINTATQVSLQYPTG